MLVTESHRHAEIITMLSGAELLGRLRASGDALNDAAQRLVARHPTARRPLLDRLHGRADQWPAVPQLRSVERLWTQCEGEIRRYADAISSSSSRADASSRDDYAQYCRRVVLARVHLEETTTPRLAAESSSGSAPAVRVTAGDVAQLRERGYCVLRTAFDPALRKDFETLHKHAVIPPTNSSCNPGAFGTNLRCGTAAEREGFVLQRTFALLDAIEQLRRLPHALLEHGYVPDGELRVPGLVLVSCYPPGKAHYQRHLDCYGDDNSRALTVIMYANAEEWDVERDGGALRLECAATKQAVDVAPRGGTVVVFSSKDVWHEVLPTRREARFALTLWVYSVPRSPTAPVPAATGTNATLVVLAADARGRTQYVWVSPECVPPGTV